MIPAPAREILELVRVTETSCDDLAAYDTIYGHHEDELDRPITEMTVAELQSYQSGFTNNFGSSASGAYQFMKATLTDLREQCGLTGKELFDVALQDRLGFELLLRRGYERWAAFEDTTDDFMVSLSQEWASFPVPYDMQGAHRWVQRGETYYAGDGLNEALVPPADVWNICEAARNGDTERSKPKPQRDRRRPTKDEPVVAPAIVVDVILRVHGPIEVEIGEVIVK